VAVALLAAGTSVALFVSHAQADQCSIESFRASNGISFSTATVPPTVEASAVNQAIERNPGASVAEQETAHLRSSQIPALNNRDLVLIRLTNVRPEPITGPVGATEKLAAVTCSIWIYDGLDASFVMGHEELAALP
jgi:hypothetical protein